MSYLAPDTNNKLCIAYTCTGKYSVFFKDFYDSFKLNFCNGNYLTFAIFTDQPSMYNGLKDVKIYHVQRNVKPDDANYAKFRKFKDILLAEDYLETQDYIFYMNGNLTCQQPVTLDELFNGKDQYAVYHSLFNINKLPMYESLTKHPKSAAFFDAQDKLSYPNYMYFQSGNIGATSKQFLKMCYYIESCRNYDLFYGYDRYIKWHDETYYNKYINTLIKTNTDKINILDGKVYLCSWLKSLSEYRKTCKMLLTSKIDVWKRMGIS